MTQDEALQQIHILLEKDTDYPSSGSEDYTVRQALLANAVRVWAYEEGVTWNELFVDLADASDGDTTTTADQEEYDAPSDLVFPVGYLRIIDSDGNSTYYKLIRPDDVQLYDNDSSTKIWWVTGNKKDGKKVHIHPAPSSSGLTISYEYYKEPTVPSSGSDVLEMSDPQFAVYWVLSELLRDENPGLAQTYQNIALNKLNAMKLRNDVPARWQESGWRDVYSGFGK